MQRADTQTDKPNISYVKNQKNMTKKNYMFLENDNRN